MKAEINIGIDNHGDRFFSVRGKDPKMPPWRTLQTIAPVEIPIEDMKEALEAFRQENQEKVNKILSNYY